MANYVSKDGLLYFWTLLKTKLAGKSDVGHTHTASNVTDFATEVAKVKVSNATTADSANAVAWTAVSGKPSSYTPSSHNQASNTINALTGYSKPSSTSALTTTDTLNAALGKLEKALDEKQASGSYQAAGTYVTASSATAVETSLSTTSDAKVPTSKAIATYVTGLGYKTTDNDTKNTAGSTASTSKLYIVGATSQAANPQTYSNANCYVGTDNCLYSNGTKVLTSHQSLSSYYTKTEIDNKLTSAMRYKGSVATYAALPTTNLTVGDMYNVTASGANYVWDGSVWDETGMVVDLSPYAKTSDLVAVTNTEIDTIVAS